MALPQSHPATLASTASPSQAQTTADSSEDPFIVPEPLAMALPPEGMHEQTPDAERGVQDNGHSVAEAEDPSKGASVFPPLRSRIISHLPTPQSPTNLGPYINGKSESPLNHGRSQATLYDGGSNITALTRRSTVESVPAGTTTVPNAAAGQMLTPDSSPTVSSRWLMPEHATTPTKPRRKTPPKTPNRSANEFVLKTEASGSSLMFTPVAKPGLAASPSSLPLSSPFVPKASAVELSPPQLPAASAATLSASPVVDIPTVESGRAPSDPAAATASSRQPGGEIERIRADQARALDEHRNETEARRPDYLKRGKRPLVPDVDDVGVGVKESPMTGRRIELWGIQETSEESFEERLMAGGYGGYGSTGPTPAERPRTPTPIRPGVPSRALEWASMATPGPPGSSKSVGSASAGGEDDAETVLDEKELKKRRRLEAFRRDGTGGDWHARSKSTLHPVEVEGKGRVLLDVGAEEVPDLLEGLAGAPSPAGKRKGGRRKKKGTTAPARAGKARARLEQRDGAAHEGGALKWPDEEFPWSLRTHERREQERMEEAERMQWIERFLEADSEESEEEEEEDGDVLPMQLDVGTPVYPRGRGKMVPMKDYPGSGKGPVLIPTDPADARAALLSKRAVRALAAKHQFRVELRRGAGNSEDEKVLCICGGRDDGRELVQCDACATWYHLECLGIKVADLGREEDAWYCPDCVHKGSQLPFEPTFVQVEEDLTPRRRRDPLFFQGPEQASPDAAWSTPARPPIPTTPTRSNRTVVTDPSTRSSYGGPSTPQSSAQHVRVYTTPGAFEHIFQHASPFDPTSTPSRGVAAFATPKGGSGVWAGARHGAPGPFVTPTPTKYALPRYTAHMAYGAAARAPEGSPYRQYDDTPVDRSAPRPVAMQPRRVMDSPLMGRGPGRRAVLGSEGSPGPARAKGKERQGAGVGR
ncbi:hypothetical protein FA95DRAFT_1681774 [Auriscalpium vulgare]|uniref:Uncharacterized protein n=1 Tax=Auriscalpium vulgare TaxID=40419 RepID=A0ACB8RHV9_9AGAM|nr:hypothetical protein FA95DRAFT_1681774 [Auriscalpium vulgare]